LKSDVDSERIALSAEEQVKLNENNKRAMTARRTKGTAR
jgi:hypothetical protein